MRFEEVKAFVVDLLTQIPASSVEVEKHHANCQVDCAVHRYNAKRAPTIQANSLIMSAMLEHQALKQAAEGCAFGKAAGRVKRLLKQRVVESTGPKCQGRLRSRTKICSDGSVKGRAGLLKGVTSLGFAYCDKQTKQTVYCKSLPSCSSSSSSYYYYYATTLSISLSLSCTTFDF